VNDMPTYYSVKKNDRGGADIAARNSHAKQAIWGWAGDYGSTKDPGAIELYGRGTRRGEGDREQWEWSLSAAGLTSLRNALVENIRDLKRYDTGKQELAAIRELLRKIDVL